MNTEESKKFILSLQESYRKDLQELGEIHKVLFGHISQIMNNLALICGAFATGAMVLLGLNIPANTDFVVFGIIVLLLEVFLIFIYLFHYHGKDTRDFFKNKRERILPSANLVILYYDQYLEGKINSEFFSEEVNKTAVEVKNDMLKANKKIINEKPVKNYWEVFFSALLAVGVMLIISGLLWPYLISL